MYDYEVTAEYEPYTYFCTFRLNQRVCKEFTFLTLFCRFLTWFIGDQTVNEDIQDDISHFSDVASGFSPPGIWEFS